MTYGKMWIGDMSDSDSGARATLCSVLDVSALTYLGGGTTGGKS